MNENIMTVDESFFNTEDSQEQSNETQVVEQKNKTQLAFDEREGNIPTMTFEDLDNMDSDGITIDEEEVTVVNNKQEAPVAKVKEKENVYAAQVEYFKKRGLLPEDAGLAEGESWDEESFEEALNFMENNMKENIEYDIREQYESKLGNNVISFLENGGDYSTFAELIKEQGVIQEFDVTTDYGQKAVTTKYYKEVLGWSENRIEKHVDRLYNDGDLQEEASECKAKFDDYFEDEQRDLVVKQVELKDRKDKMVMNQKNSFANTLKNSGVALKDIPEMVDYVFKDAWTLPNGTPIPEIDYEILLMQRKPEELSELVQFLRDKQGYLRRKAIEINNEKVDKTFKKIVQNQVTNKGSIVSPEDVKRPRFQTRL